MDLNRLFRPSSVAIVGASGQTAKHSGRVVSNFRDNFGGRTYLVNPNYDAIDGDPCWPDISSLPEIPDLALVARPAVHAVNVVRAAGEFGVGAAVVFDSGFSETGLEGLRLEDALRRVSVESNIAVLGPNTSGFRNGWDRVPATFSLDAGLLLEPGPIAIIAQSGGLASYFGGFRLRAHGVNAGFIIDTGNEAAVTLADCVDYLLGRGDISTIGIVAETVSGGREFLNAVRRACAMRKNLIIYKLGKGEGGRLAVAAHIGKLAGEYEVAESLCLDAGATWCETEEAFMSCLIGGGDLRREHQTRAALVSMSGAVAGILADECEQYSGIHLPDLSELMGSDGWAALRSELPQMVGTNPIDLGGIIAQRPEIVSDVIRKLVESGSADVILLWIHHLLRVSSHRDKLLPPLLAAGIYARTCGVPLVLVGDAPEPVMAELQGAGIALHEFPVGAIRSISAHRPNRNLGRGRPIALAEMAFKDSLSLHDALGMLEAGGLAVAPYSFIPRDQSDGTMSVRFPLYVKISSIAVPHKGQAGALEKVDTSHQLPAAVRGLLDRFQDAEGVILQEEILATTEVYAACMIDPVFGQVLALGSGGTDVEVKRDIAFVSLPTSLDHIEAALERTRLGRHVLGDVRFAKLLDYLEAFSCFASSVRERYSTIEINPLLVQQDGAVFAVDCKAIRKQPMASAPFGDVGGETR